MSDKPTVRYALFDTMYDDYLYLEDGTKDGTFRFYNLNKGTYLHRYGAKFTSYTQAWHWYRTMYRVWLKNLDMNKRRCYTIKK